MGHEVAHSLVARLNGVQEAAGSTPVTRTNKRIANAVLFLFYLKTGRIEPCCLFTKFASSYGRGNFLYLAALRL